MVEQEVAKKKDLNIVFLNHFCKDDIFQAIESALSEISTSVFSIQITVVDNSGNKDGIRQGLEKYGSHVQYIDSGGNIGFGQGNAVGFKAVPARYYFALNRDTVVISGSKTFDRLIEFMDKNPKIGCVGPKLVHMDGTLQHSCFRFDLSSILIKPLKQISWDKKYKWVKKHTDRLMMNDFDHNETLPVDWVLGAAMVVRHEVVEMIGWFDERYFMYLEDCDWCKTMWEKGWPVYYVHDIVIKHRHTRESAKVPGLLRALLKNKLARIHLVSWFKYMWKWKASHRFYGKLS
jgi:GT2 family glycosyltransferase